MSAPAPLWPRIVLGALAVLLVVGLVELFRARFATGDVYPEYSTLRSDPLGARVLFEALDTAGIETMRNHRDVARASLGTGTIYLCGMRWRDLEANDVGDVKALLDSVRTGNRLVMAFAPQDPELERKHAIGVDADERRENRAGGDDKEPEVSLAQELRVDARWLPAENVDGLQADRVANLPLPMHLPWHTALAFEPNEETWSRIYAISRYSAVLERPYGQGSIVLVGDAFLLSNEAMKHARESSLIAWLQGPNSRAVFDETHLGVVENSGIAALARRYGLAHAALALLAIAVLYLWKNGSSLVPASRRQDDDAEELVGRDASSGLVNLLRRTIPASELFSACLAEYKHSAAWRRLTPDVQRTLETLRLTSGGKDGGPQKTLHAAHELLKRKI